MIKEMNAHIAKVQEMRFGKPASHAPVAPNAVEHAKMTAEQEEFVSSMQRAKAIFADVKTKISQINRDPDLNGVGKAKKEREAKLEGAISLARMVKEYEVARDIELALAEKTARSIISTDNAQPDDNKIQEFEKKLAELKTQISVFGSSAAAREYQQLLNGETDPYFANKLVEDFATVGPALRDHVNVMDLQTAYSNAKRTAETDSRVEARKALDQIEALRKQPPVDSMIGMGISSALGDEYKSLLTNPSGFLAAHGA